MKIIDTKTWNRKAAYNNFINYTNPIFSLSTRLDVTDLYTRCKTQKRSFFADFLYLAVRCLNSIDEFKLRIYNDNVVSFDIINPSYIVLADDNAIVTCATEMCDSYEEFYKNVREDIENAKHNVVNKKFNNHTLNNLFYISCLPWTDIVSVINPYDLKNPEDSSIPRLTWGKATEESGRVKMMMDISAHHALIDGEPVCRAFNKIQDALNHLEKVY